MMDTGLTEKLKISGSELIQLAAYLGVSCNRIRARILEGGVTVVKLPSGGVRVIITNKGQN